MKIPEWCVEDAKLVIKTIREFITDVICNELRKCRLIDRTFISLFLYDMITCVTEVSRLEAQQLYIEHMWQTRPAVSESIRQKESQTFVENMQRNLPQLAQIANDIINGDITGENARLCSEIIAYLRVYYDYITVFNKSYHPQFHDSIFETQIQNAVSYDFAINDSTTVAKLERVIIRYTFIDHSSLPKIESIMNLASDLREQLALYKSVDTLIDVLDSIYTATTEQVKSMFAPLGPKWVRAFQVMIDGGVEAIRDNHTVFLYDGSALRKAWHETWDVDHSSVIDKITEIARDWVARSATHSPPEAPEGALLDQYAFAQQRVGVAREKNNKFEDGMLRAIKLHFNMNTSFAAVYGDAIKEFLEKGQYTEVFHEPKANWIYRGMHVDLDYMMNALNVSEIPDKGIKAASFTFTPLYGASSSWTESPQVAWNFANNSNSKAVKLILCARRDKNHNAFIAGPGGLYTVKNASGYLDEEEIIGINAIKVSKIFWSKYNLIHKPKSKWNASHIDVGVNK